METNDLVVSRHVDAVEAEAWRDFYAAAPAEFAAMAGLSVRRVAGATVLAARELPEPLFNRVIGLGQEREATEADVDAVLAALHEAAAPRFWIHVSPSARPEAIPAWLERRGLVPSTPRAWAKVARGTEPPPVIDTPYVVREVGREAAAVVGRVIVEAHEIPPDLAPWIEALVGRPGWRAYLAFAGDEPVAAGFLRVQGETGWLGMGGTIPARRNRGGQGAIMAQRVRDAIAAGCTLIATETDEPAPGETIASLSNMLRCGFRKVAVRLNYGVAP